MHNTGKVCVSDGCSKLIGKEMWVDAQSARGKESKMKQWDVGATYNCRLKFKPRETRI